MVEVSGVNEPYGVGRRVLTVARIALVTPSQPVAGRGRAPPCQKTAETKCNNRVIAKLKALVIQQLCRCMITREIGCMSTVIELLRTFVVVGDCHSGPHRRSAIVADIRVARRHDEPASRRRSPASASNRRNRTLANLSKALSRRMLRPTASTSGALSGAAAGRSGSQGGAQNSRDAATPRNSATLQLCNQSHQLAECRGYRCK